MQTLTRNTKLDAADGGVLSRARGRRDSGGRAAGVRQRRRWLAAFAAGLALTLANAGCDDSKPRGGDSSAPPLSAPPQSTRSTAEEQALTAYKGMWQAYAQAGLTADPDDPDLARYAAGTALETLQRGLTGYHDKSQVLKGELVTNPQVSGASPDADPKSVAITDCLDATNFLVYKSSGELANDTPGGRRSTRATVTNVGAEGWKVTSFGVQAVNTC
ncbi:hypothetical protein [Actinoplanes sp. NPDC026623]|uniref:hypothetical protein n=1 Tax=Actinoplanes sp. NPDC026623 TaxID=3155610 RepID=UPI0034019CD3